MKRRLLIFLWLMAGCGGSSNTGGGHPDGGNPDSGNPDSGTPCVDTIANVPLETWVHIPLGSTPNYANNPPVSGEHYGEAWGAYRIHTNEVPRGYWVHNLEHGGVIFVYRPDAPQAIIDALAAAYAITSEDQHPACVTAGVHYPRIVMTPDHLLPPDLPWAALVAAPPAGGVGFMVKGACVNTDTLKTFTETRRGNSGVEEDCTQGTFDP